MRRFGVIFTMFLLFMGLQITANAAPRVYSRNVDTCCLLIATPDLKTEDFMNAMEDKINPENQQNAVVGTAIQTKYQEYWLNKGELEEGKLTKDIMHDFVKFSGFKKCLFVIPTMQMEKSKVPSGLFMRVEKNRASIEVKGFLVDDANVLKIINVTQNDDSIHSDLRAKRGAFEKGMRDLASRFITYIKTGK